MAALPTIAFDVAHQVGWEGLAQCLCEANRFGLAPLILPIICLTSKQIRLPWQMGRMSYLRYAQRMDAFRVDGLVVLRSE